MITANDFAWEEQIKIDKQVGWFKTHPMKWRVELDQIFGNVTATGKYAQGDTPIDPLLLGEAQGEDGGDEQEEEELDAQRATQQDTQSMAPPISRCSTPLKRDISQLLTDSSELSNLSNASKKTKNGAMLLLVKQIGNQLSNPSNESDLKVKAVKILQSKNDAMSEDEFNVALDIIEKHAVVFVTLSQQRCSTWLSRKIEAVVGGNV